jgi:Tol biopolymer transport system component
MLAAATLAAATAAAGATSAVAPQLVVSTNWSTWSDDHVVSVDGLGRIRSLAVGTLPAASPDGRLVAFVRNRGLWVMSTAGGPARLLTVPDGDVAWRRAPVWSPDGHHLALALAGSVELVDAESGTTVQLDGATAAGYSPDGSRVAFVDARGLVVANADGSAQAVVDPQWRDAVGVSWSPSGRSIALAATSAGGGVDEAVVSPDGTPQWTFSTGSGYGSAPAWSNDGRLAWLSGNAVQVATPTGRVRAVARALDLGWPEPAPAWSPDGSHIALHPRGAAIEIVSSAGGPVRFLRPKSPADVVTSGVDSLGSGWLVAAHTRSRDLELALVRADGSGFRALTRNTFDDVDPVWSPDGRTILFARLGASRHGLYTMSTDGGAVHRLTDGADRAPAFSPDGRAIAFSRGDSVMVMSAGGGPPRDVAQVGVRLRQLSWTEDGAALVYSEGWVLRRLTLATGAVSTIDVGGEAVRPVISPDGSLIAFHGYLNAKYFRDPNAYGVYVVHLDGSDPRKVVAGFYGPTSWSPDGWLLAATDGVQLLIAPSDGSAPSGTPLLPNARTPSAAFRP